jgi:16S rRNA (guanine(966)-N(2))-methyltransferase RsmD
MRGKRLEGKAGESGSREHKARSAKHGAASVSKGLRRTDARFARAPAQVRIIGGQWKRTPLPVIDVAGLRPSPDRVRETLFNWLAHFIPEFGAVRGLDLFAGTGALGFELASRGASKVTLVERNPMLVEQLRRIREKLEAANVDIVGAEALAFARAAPDDGFEVVFLDPPFDAGLLEPALAQAARLVTEQGLVYAESGAELTPDIAEGHGLTIVRAGRAGQVRFHLLQKA